MGLHSHQNTNLVLSADAKPRLKWTSELHQRFVEAVNQLGGPDKATPKGLMRVMGIHGLTLYHLKSHLQKYRLGKNSQSQSGAATSKQEVSSDADYPEIQSVDNARFIGQRISDVNQINPMNEGFQIAQALQMQMEVQRKLHDQIEVQRHLQLRIEAQGKYLQSILKKAQEALSGSNCSSVGIELATDELSRIVSMVNTSCQSSTISELTELEGYCLRDIDGKHLQSTVCSMDSSLTSSDITKFTRTSIELPLMDVHSRDGHCYSGSSKERRNRNCSSFYEPGFLEQQPARRLRNGGHQLINNGVLVSFDLNAKCQNESGSDPTVIELNGNDHLHDHL